MFLLRFPDDRPFAPNYIRSLRALGDATRHSAVRAGGGLIATWRRELTESSASDRSVLRNTV